MRSFMLMVVVVCVILAFVGEARLSNRQEWLAYKQNNGKVYETPEEDARRFALFLRSKARMAMVAGCESHKSGLSHLFHWSDSEFKRLRGFKLPTANGLTLKKEHMRNIPEAEQFLADILADDSKPVPDELDWRKVPGRVSAVKDQKECASSWAFATTGLLEGQQVINGNNKTLIPLSEQELVDCSIHDEPCASGLIGHALTDIANLGGIESEQDYPYVASFNTLDKLCKFNKSKIVMTVAGPAYLPQKDEEKIKQVVAKYGPVAVAIDSAGLFNYEQGVIMGETCSDTKDFLDHAILIVGYGADPKFGDFWTVKNSWSDQWGEQGYFRISRGKNTCGISWYAVIAKF